jgi:phosphoheptose isomerase
VDCLANRASHQTLASASEQGRQQSSDGNVLWGQSTRSDTDDTLKASRQVHTQGLATKVMSGGDVKAFPRCPEEIPRELKPRRGSRRRQG